MIRKDTYKLVGTEFRIYSFIFISFVVSEFLPRLHFLQTYKHWAFVFHWPWDSGRKCTSGYRSFDIYEFKNK